MDTPEKGGAEPSNTATGYEEWAMRFLGIDFATARRQTLGAPILRLVRLVQAPDGIKKTKKVIKKTKKVEPDGRVSEAARVLEVARSAKDLRGQWERLHVGPLHELVDALERLLSDPDFGADAILLRPVLAATAGMLARFNVEQQAEAGRREIDPRPRMDEYSALASDRLAPPIELRQALNHCLELLRTGRLIRHRGSPGQPFGVSSDPAVAEATARGWAVYLRDHPPAADTDVATLVAQRLDAAVGCEGEGRWNVELGGGVPVPAVPLTGDVPVEPGIRHCYQAAIVVSAMGYPIEPEQVIRLMEVRGVKSAREIRRRYAKR